MLHCHHPNTHTHTQRSPFNTFRHMKAHDSSHIRKQPSDKRDITPIIQPHYLRHDSNSISTHAQTWEHEQITSTKFPLLLRRESNRLLDTKHSLSVNTHHTAHCTGNLVDVQHCRHVSSSDHRTDAFSGSLFSLSSERGAVAGGKGGDSRD